MKKIGVFFLVALLLRGSAGKERADSRDEDVEDEFDWLECEELMEHIGAITDHVGTSFSLQMNTSKYAHLLTVTFLLSH